MSEFGGSILEHSSYVLKVVVVVEVKGNYGQFNVNNDDLT